MRQPELPIFHVTDTDVRVRQFVELLQRAGWLTRAQIQERLGWDERVIRMIAEAAGSQVVRGQRGFNVVENCSIEEIDHASNQALSQGKHMIRYALGLKRRAHQAVG